MTVIGHLLLYCYDAVLTLGKLCEVQMEIGIVYLVMCIDTRWHMTASNHLCVCACMCECMCDIPCPLCYVYDVILLRMPLSFSSKLPFVPSNYDLSLSPLGRRGCS